MNSKPANIYESLGVTPVINAAGTFTDLGGSLMPSEVLTAWTSAAQHHVDFQDLQERVGERIAGLLGVDAALVTGGAASGILLGTAAAVTLRDPDFPTRSELREVPLEVLRPTAHRNLYDRQVETCGVRIVDVDSADDVARKVTERTVLMMFYNVHEPDGAITHESWLRLARQFSIPTLLDAAADTPPVENLWKYNRMGFDMVVFSGGKAIRGPQSSGLLLGRSDLVAAARRNAVPNEGSIGRVAKVSKEDVVALWQALQMFVAEGDSIAERCEEQLRVITDVLSTVNALTCRQIVPPVANHFPHLLLTWDEMTLGMTATDLATALRDGTPSIATARVHGTGADGLLISVIGLKPGEDRIVAERIHEVFCGYTNVR